jgi:predicted permease
MTVIRDMLARIVSIFRKRKLDEDFDAELGSHLELATEENLKRGMTPEEARRKARIQFGGLDAARELHRESRGLPAFETVVQDIRYSFRTLRRDAGLAIFAILIVGLGVGACSTVFSVVNAMLLRPLPFKDPGRLVWLANDLVPGLSGQTVQVAHVLDLRSQSRSFADVAGYFAFYSAGGEKLTGSGEPERLTSIPVSENFFSLLGVQPQLGRPFTPDECRINGPRAVMLGHRLWEQRFASDPSIVGRAISLNEQATTVVGVLPASFDFATVFAPGTKVDFYRPFPMTPETSRMGNTMSLVGRLKPGVAIEAARAETAAVVANIRRENPRRNGLKLKLTALREQVSGQFRSAMYILIGAVGLVMLIVCANLSNLLLARTATREKEIAVRAALGANRWRLIRQMLTESLVLSSSGALLGLLLALAGTRLLSRLDGIRLPMLEQVQVDVWALGFTLLIAVLTGVVFGLTPALRVSSLALHSSLKESGRGASQGSRQGWIRGALVASEVAFACVLLVGAGLLLRSFIRVLEVDLGFKPQNAISLRVDPNQKYSSPALRNSYYDEILNRVRSAPGIEHVGLTDALPLVGNRSWPIGAKGQVYTPETYPEAFVRIVSDGYIGAMGIPLIAGRDFTAADVTSSPSVIIINQTFARRLWPGEDPLGKIIMNGNQELQVVGVVRDVRHLALEEEGGNEFYIPIRQTQDYASVTMIARGSLSQSGLTAAVRDSLLPIDPNLPTKESRAIRDLVDKAISPQRLIVLLLSGFAGFALLLASLGIYGVISYSVNQRKQEIGIRMALGASTGNLQKLILSETLKLAAVGMVVGLVASWLLGRLFLELLFGIKPTDPLTFVIVFGLLMGVAALAGYLPARRASRLDPLDALRVD